MNLSDFFDSDLLTSTIRVATPVLLAALGGLLTMRAGIYNIALEGQMISGSFAAIAVTAWTGNLYLGILGGILAGTLTSALLALAVLKFNANDIVASIAINLLAVGLTGFLLQTIFDVRGTYRPEGMHGLPAIDIPWVENIPIIGPAISGQTLLVYVALGLVAFTHVLLYRTPLGLAIRAVGEKPDAARTAGVSPILVRATAVLYSGVLCGLAGAHLSLGYASEFTVGMTAGRGFTGFSAAIFGQLQPWGTLAASLVFGLAEALGLRMQLSDLALPPDIVEMVPYVLAIVAISITCAIRMWRLGSTRRREVPE
ncbi:ABC transporter permease [Nocardioides soli]|uniref:Simple sugar transport system permease protein n=1 Tax=Nocardioides soli TaxID=1036020 RepID=A0A7W4Z1P9_9ACTN|nr:ABC transporter permease [Nocardioides soli]MBB3043098.1 simple sugar transport system permease protein [Nocardioides soli]